MGITLNRLILYVRDVDRLAAFYQSAFGLDIVEEISGEWAVLDAGACQLALHRVGPAYRGTERSMAESNAKLVLTIDCPLAALRDALIAKGVQLGEIKSYPGVTGLLCDGRDPEGNVFQLAEPLRRPA
jgi:predicted enzyme related to lactoylglutathione lyase